jgi:peptide/nickel transport system permease protein
MGMARLALWRVLAVVPIMLVVSFVTFVLLSMNPVDPAEQLLGPTATEEQLATGRHELGLDEPLLERYADWLGDAATGDLGQSIYTTTPVATSIRDRAGVTLSLTIGGLIVALVIGFPAGAWSAMRAGRPADRLTMVAATVGQAVPAFWLGTLLLLVFAVRWSIFNAVFYVPPSDSVAGWLKSIVLPSVALGASGAAWIARQTRSELVTVLQQDYVRTALAKGASRRQVLFGHALRNAAGPLLTVVALLVSAVLSASFVIEAVFALPGLGSLALESINRNDPAPVLGFVVCVVFVVVIFNVMLDLIQGWLNPKVRAL